MLKLECRYFPGDRPCPFHKETGIKCDNCGHYKPIDFKILVIKLDARGDVLRTTALLPSIKEKYPDSHVTWITEKKSMDLFLKNESVDEILEYPGDAICRLQIEHYNLVINLDSSPKSSCLASIAKGKEKLGFGLSEKGYVFPYNAQAENWLEMGAFDDVKTANRKTYQQIIHEICGLIISPKSKIILKLSDAETKFAREFAERHGILDNELVIGLNTGAGTRWKLKKWTMDGFVNLIKLTRKGLNARILLYGGTLEEDRHKKLVEIFGSDNNIIDTGNHNSLREFFALLSLVDVIVTGDSLALHAALGLDKKVIALFGPTSPQEIELYGMGIKVIPDLDCIGCYKKCCDKRPNCMESITVKMVYEALQKLIST